MRTMHEFDSLLRQSFEQGINNDKVIFVERDGSGNIVPCSPSKILITSTETIKPFKRFLPIGFQTKPRTAISKVIEQIDEILSQAAGGNTTNAFTLTSEQAKQIINLIYSTFEYSDRWENTDYEWDKDSFLSILQRLNSAVASPAMKDKIYCLVKTDRNISRYKNNGASFSDAPDDNRSDYAEAKNLAMEIPCLILLKENGLESQGWRDTPFWYPVLVAPKNARNAVFATETISN